MRGWSYLIAAAALGGVWFAALRVPFATRELFPPIALPYVCVTSMIVAALFRRVIISADLARSIALAVALPLAGAMVFSVLAMVRRPLPTIEAIALFPIMAVLISVGYGFYVVFPMGFLSQAVMAPIGRGAVTDTDRRFWRVASAVVVVVLLPAAWLKQTDGVHEVTKQMSWEVQRDLVVLTFVDHSDQSLGIYSEELARHLLTRGERTVPVTFQVTYRGRTFAGYHETSVAGLTRWSESQAGYGSADESAFEE